MIYIHRFIAGIDGNRKELTKVYDNINTAMEQQAVLGGSVQEFVAVEEIGFRANVAMSEIAEKFDEIASDNPEMEVELMLHKVDLNNKVSRIVNGQFDRETGEWI